MSRPETPMTLFLRYPQAVLGIGAMILFVAITGRFDVGLISAIVTFALTKKQMVQWLRSDQSGYLDRETQSYDPQGSMPTLADRLDQMPRYSDVKAADLDMQAAADEDWVAPIEPAMTVIPEVPRAPSTARYGIAVPPRKPVDVPRR